MKCCLGFELKKGSDFFMVGERLCIVGGHYDGQYGSFLGDWGTKMARVLLEDDASKTEHHLLLKSCAKYCPPNALWYLHDFDHPDVVTLRKAYVDMGLEPHECPKCCDKQKGANRPCAAEMMRDTFHWIGVSLRYYHMMSPLANDCFGYREECRNECDGWYAEKITKSFRLHKDKPNGPCRMNKYKK